MSYSVSRNEIEIDGQVFEIERDEDHGMPGGTNLYVIDPDSDEGDRIDGLWGFLGYEEDSSFANPRDWCNIGMMICDYRGYLLGDQDGPSLDDLQGNYDTCDMCEGTGEIEAANAECPKCEGSGDVLINIVDYIRREYSARVILPLYVYEHSGITMRAGAPIGPQLTKSDVRSSGRFIGDDAGWDTSTVGFTFDTPEQVKQVIGDNATDKQIEAALKQEVEIYASYLEGDVTYWRVSDDETGFEEGCGGYVGDSDHTESECFSELESALRKRLAENVERNYWLAREVETV